MAFGKKNHLHIVENPDDELQHATAAEEYALTKVAEGLASGVFTEEDAAGALVEFTRAYHTNPDIT